MKYNKRFTEGLAYFAAFLVIIFLAYSYFSFEGAYVDEETGETVTVMTAVKGMKEYLILLGATLGSAIVCSATDRLPFIGLLASAAPVWYIMKLIVNDMLVFCPNIILILTVLALGGQIVASVQWTREKLRKKIS